MQEKCKQVLEALYEDKVEGIILRARARWHEHGENNCPGIVASKVLRPCAEQSFVHAPSHFPFSSLFTCLFILAYTQIPRYFLESVDRVIDRRFLTTLHPGARGASICINSSKMASK